MQCIGYALAGGSMEFVHEACLRKFMGTNLNLVMSTRPVFSES